LHERIRADLERRVLRGTWPPGHRIPIERELMQTYRCSRMTVSKAIAALVDAGLIVRRRRAGSFVARPRVHSAVLTIPDIQAEVEQRGAVYGYELLSRQRRPARAGGREQSALEGASALLALHCRHLADGEVLAIEDRLISLTAVPGAQDVDFTTTSPGTWLLGHVPWTEAEHRISAIAADAASARLLGVRQSTACLSLERRTWRGRDEITYARQIFPGHRYDLVARFSPAGPARRDQAR
jgi:GntR family histidine utilization transcriptional repressor